jgi:hypothetical protein
MDNEDGVPDFDPYIFNVDLGATGDSDYKGPQLFIWGKDSVAGKINDSLSVGATEKRNTNLRAWIHFDPATHNPQLVFYALCEIQEGDELLYSYGAGYWKFMWKSLMMGLAVDTAKMALHSRKIKEAIDQHKAAYSQEESSFEEESSSEE